VPRRGPQAPRTATLAVRWCPLTLCPPRHRKRERLPPVPLWAVQAREEVPPAGTAPVEWLLLTTCAVHTAAEALERMDWYACRWGVEVLQSQDIKCTRDAFFFLVSRNRLCFKGQHVGHFDRPIGMHHNLFHQQLDYRLPVLKA
jgi:hypothetical protein